MSTTDHLVEVFSVAHADELTAAEVDTLHRAAAIIRRVHRAVVFDAALAADRRQNRADGDDGE